LIDTADIDFAMIAAIYFIADASFRFSAPLRYAKILLIFSHTYYYIAYYIFAFDDIDFRYFID
jgi:hypothetical protein